MSISGDGIFAVARDGSFQRLNVTDGAVVWRIPNVCSASHPRGSITATAAQDNAVVVGCSDSGRLVRIDAATGRVEASRVVLDVLRFSELRFVDHDTLAVTGFADGAILVLKFALVRDNDFVALMRPQVDEHVLGILEDQLILSNSCCMGDLDGPIKIIRFDLRTRKVLAETSIDRPRTGIVATPVAFLSGAKLFIRFADLLLSYGSVLEPATAPTVVSDGLSGPLEFVAGHFEISSGAFGDRRTTDIYDLAGPSPKIIWRGRGTWLGDPGEPATSRVIMLRAAAGSLFLLPDEGTHFSTVVPCRAPVLAGRHLIALCSYEEPWGTGNAIQSYATGLTPPPLH